MEASLWKKRWEAYKADGEVTTQVLRFGRMVTEPEIVTSWDRFQRWAEGQFDEGLFRGVDASSWALEPSAQWRLYRQFDVDDHTTMAGPINRLENERSLLSKFQSKASAYHLTIPEPDQIIDWLVLGQHYSLPTRFLDWSMSPFVAAYFALEKEHSCHIPAIWALDRKWLIERSEELLLKHYPTCATAGTQARYDFISANLLTLEDTTVPVILEATPLGLNERIAIQEGVLLTNINPIDFTRALATMMFQPTEVTRQVISKIEIDRAVRTEFLERLRDMGISKDTLFPGNDELGRSLAAGLIVDVEQQVKTIKQEILEARDERRKTARA